MSKVTTVCVWISTYLNTAPNHHHQPSGGMPTTRNTRAGTANAKDPAPGNVSKQGRRSALPPPSSPAGEDEFHNATEYTVNSKEDGINYLTCHLLSTPDRPMDLHNILAALHQITHLLAVPLPSKRSNPSHRIPAERPRSITSGVCTDRAIHL